MKPLIVGIGNVLREDDGFGAAAIKALSGFLDKNSCELLSVHQLTPELAEMVSKSKLAVFIDASATLLSSDVSCQEIIPEKSVSGSAWHQNDPQKIVSLAKELYGKAPRSFIVSVGGVSFGYGQNISPKVARVLPEVIDLVCGLISGSGKDAAVCQACEGSL